MKISSTTKKIFSGGAQAPFFMNKFLTSIRSQQKAALALHQIIESNRIPHAFLFKGSEGVGKEFLAFQFTKALAQKYSPQHLVDAALTNIERLNEPYIKYIYALPRGKNENESNGPFEKLSESDLEVIQTELATKVKNPFYKLQIPKANTIKINSIRDISKFLSISFEDLTHRVVVISEAHLMNEPAQNALLKSLEEPPRGVIFILCTAYSERLKETIRSRCWTINFNPMSDEELVDVLTLYFSTEKSLAEKVVPFASGSVTVALELLENDFEELREKTIRILRYSFGKRFNSAFSELSEISESQDQLQFKILIKMIITWLNDLHRFKVGYNNYFFNQHLDTLQKFNAKFPNMELSGVTNRIDLIGYSLKNNINLNTAIGNLIVELSAIIP
jgi:DNA polymerase III subunit delta'